MTEFPTAPAPSATPAVDDAPTATDSPVRALSGRPVAELTLDAVRAGELGQPDLRIHPETLERQAVIAETHGNPQLAANLRRAAELTAVPDDEVLSIYEVLRPGRSTAADLVALAQSLEARGLPLNAALIAEAAEIYAKRGLSRAPRHD
ncbi:MAG: dehydratase small subunit [Actinomycetia bacterium]|nr:dehydratase small subunit [Actinomycetes bacterium]